MRDLIEADPLPETLNLRAVYCLNGCKSPVQRGLPLSRQAPRALQPFDARACGGCHCLRACTYQANATGEVSEDDTPTAMRGKMTVHTPPIG